MCVYVCVVCKCVLLCFLSLYKSFVLSLLLDVLILEHRHVAMETLVDLLHQRNGGRTHVFLWVLCPTIPFT